MNILTSVPSPFIHSVNTNDVKMLESSITDAVDAVERDARYQVFDNTKYGAVVAYDDFVRFKLSDDEILESINDSDIIEYVSSDLGYLVYESEREARLEWGPEFDSGQYGSSLFRTDCLDLFNTLANRHGYDVIYNALCKLRDEKEG